jgi:cell wall-associated NlpC family hydrolase
MTSVVVRRPGAPVARRLGLAVATAALSVSLLPALAAPVHAAPAPVASGSLAPVARTASTVAPVTVDVRTLRFARDGRVKVGRAILRDARARGTVVIAVAKRYQGIPYRAGGTTPSGFDCSGYVRYVHSRLGISLPRVSRDQYRAATPIRRSAAVPGDLVFFYSGSGWIYHAAIYAGNGYVWHSPYTGKRVSKERIWSSKVKFARVRL